MVTDLLRFFFISFEALAAVGVVAVWYFAPRVPATIGEAVIARDTVATLLAASLPGLLCAATWAVSAKILFPGSTNKALVKWPNYPLLKNRVVFSLALEALGSAVGVTLLIFGKAFYSATVGLIMLLALILPMVAFFHCALASLTIRQIMEELKEDK